LIIKPTPQQAMDVPATYHPQESGSVPGGDSLPVPIEGLDFATNPDTTLEDNNAGMILGDVAANAAAAAAAAAVAAAGTPLDSSQPLSMLPSPPLSGRPPSGSARSLKATEKMICQVDDCRAPLEGLKDYHQRYKVCDVHLKIEWIEREGRKVRFCQQCGRFQPLEEFDGMKRSCRARLQKHNARRRKKSRDGGGGGSGDTNMNDLAMNSAAAGSGMHHMNQNNMHRVVVPTSIMHDPVAQTAIAAGFNAAEVYAMQEAMQFASATLMQTTAAAAAAGANVGGVAGLPTTTDNTTTSNNTNANAVNMAQPPNVDVSAATAAASIAAMPFGGSLQSMPFIPSKEVMTLLLKAYAGMFHYSIENVNLKAHGAPSNMQELAAPLEAAAVAMTGNGHTGGASGNGDVSMIAAAAAAGDENAAAHLMEIQAQQAAAAAGEREAGGEYAAAAAAAAAAAGMYAQGSDGHGGQVDMSTMPPSIQ
jgi:SBP domain